MDEESLFAAALERASPGERRAFLDGACAGDAALRRRVELLLEAHERSTGILDQAGGTRDPAEVTAPADLRGGPGLERAGDLIAGRYRLLEPVGEGGMGTVWAAEQAHPVRRKVALKLIKAGMDSRSVLARFDAERQALALMDHPNIAKVLDGGATGAGRPFFVMEYVEGVPITQYCDGARLGIGGRLELLAAVCRAVQHAHAKGVIHRDLKPGNILVGLSDGRPVPRVIDFGLAKAMSGTLTDWTLQTAQGVMMGTPLYVSPEQADPANPDVDTRTDIYALGVILYELLTGSTPLEARRFREAGWQEALRMIKEEEPPRPSARLGASDALPALAARRRLDPSRLTRAVRGELDWIVMKCLEKDRSRRYESAGELGRDLERYLADRPVEACPPSAGYRIGKFLRRHRGPALAASAILLLLAGGVAGTAWGLVRADRARKSEAARADGERRANDRAQKRLRQVEAGVEALASVFHDLDPRAEEKEGRPLRAILGDRLARAAALLEGEGVGDPLTVAGLQDRLGRSLLGLGLAPEAVPLFEKAWATREALRGSDDPEALDSLGHLARAHRAAGRLDRAMPLLEEAFRLRAARSGPDDPGTITAMGDLAGGHREAGRLDLAVPLFEEVLRRRRALLGPGHPRTLDGMNDLAVAYRDAGKPGPAMPLLEEALRGRRALLGPDHVDTLDSMNNLADAHQSAGRLDLAVPLYEETLRLRRARLGPEHVDTLDSMNNLASAYRHSRKPKLALPLFEEAYRLTEARRGADHPGTLRSMNNLAGSYREAGRLDLALPLYEKSLERIRAVRGSDHPETLDAMNNLAVGYRSLNKPEKALPLLEEAVRMMKDRRGADHPATLVAMSNLAGAYKATGKLDLAVPLFEEALGLMKAKFGADHPDTLAAMSNLASAYGAARRLDLAVPLLKDAASGLERRRFADQNAGQVLRNLVGTLEHLGRLDEAEGWRRKWLEALEAGGEAGSAAHAAELRGLGGNLLGQEKWPEAEAALRRALAALEKSEPDSRATWGARSMLGRALAGQKRYEDAEPWLVRAYEEAGPREGEDPAEARRRLEGVAGRLARLYEEWGRPEKAREWRARGPGPATPAAGP